MYCSQLNIMVGEEEPPLTLRSVFVPPKFSSVLHFLRQFQALQVLTPGNI